MIYEAHPPILSPHGNSAGAYADLFWAGNQPSIGTNVRRITDADAARLQFGRQRLPDLPRAARSGNDDGEWRDFSAFSGCAQIHEFSSWQPRPDLSGLSFRRAGQSAGSSAKHRMRRLPSRRRGRRSAAAGFAWSFAFKFNLGVSARIRSSVYQMSYQSSGRQRRPTTCRGRRPIQRTRAALFRLSRCSRDKARTAALCGDFHPMPFLPSPALLRGPSPNSWPRRIGWSGARARFTNLCPMSSSTWDGRSGTSCDSLGRDSNILYQLSQRSRDSWRIYVKRRHLTTSDSRIFGQSDRHCFANSQCGGNSYPGSANLRKLSRPNRFKFRCTETASFEYTRFTSFRKDLVANCQFGFAVDFRRGSPGVYRSGFSKETETMAKGKIKNE